MHKIVSVFLAILMIASLCACGSQSVSLDPLSDDLQQAQEALNRYAVISQGTAAEADHVQTAEDFRWNGKTELWIVLPTDVTADDLVAADVIGSMAEANGWVYTKKELGSGSGTAYSVLQAAIAGGKVGAVVFTSALTEYMLDYVQSAADVGIIVLTMKADGATPVAASVATSYTQLGAESVAIMEAWAQQVGVTPDEEQEPLPVALNDYGEENPDTPWLSAARSALAQSDVLEKAYLGLASTGDTVYDSAFLWAQRVMENFPALRIFCCYSPEAAYGVCFYLEQYCADNELDLADFCVVWQGRDAQSDTYLSVARESNSYTAARGYTVSADDAWTLGARLGSQLLGVAYGAELPAGLAETFALPAENGVSAPDSFAGWQWGLLAYAGIESYVGFGSYENGLFRRLDMPLADLLSAAEAEKALAEQTPEPTEQPTQTEQPENDPEQTEADDTQSDAAATPDSTDPGDTNPDPGNTDPDPGNTDPDPGNTDPDPGNTDPDPGNTDPDPGNTDPDPGNTDPDPGNTDPDPGNTEPESGGTDAETP